MGKRRKGREIVLQSMYASLISGAPLLDVLDDQIQRRESAPESATFARDLAGKVKLHSGDIDRWLRTLVTGSWDPDRLGSLEMVILSMGLAELRYSPDVPHAVVINEALELAHRYCEDGSVGFVNGVLDKAASQVTAAAPAADKDEGTP
ncbi:transcription antitermination factor NusB [bacterium CG17_big_fil_post_rev_8_21_14_2_50_64_8]|nr:MAG: transcription antitermination factor NusB [bacterium CG17_big_fil_post_rev_8_21_14_2_50_64_8]PJA75939.1 MAG: transcription antitermination factor NusB [bacterium CG_4_9_14_3_um_filter_65_15]